MSGLSAWKKNELERQLLHKKWVSVVMVSAGFFSGEIRGRMAKAQKSPLK